MNLTGKFLKVVSKYSRMVTPEIAQIHRRDGQNMTRGKDLRELGFIEVVKRSLDRRRAQGAGEP